MPQVDGMAVAIAPALLEELKARAAASPGIELCGLLFGDTRAIGATRATLNVAEDPATAFEIDPGALIAALRAERAGGPRLIGCYHSHPNGDASPSPRDVAAAQAGAVWLILAGDEARLWRARAGGFDELVLDAAQWR